MRVGSIFLVVIFDVDFCFSYSGNCIGMELLLDDGEDALKGRDTHAVCDDGVVVLELLELSEDVGEEMLGGCRKLERQFSSDVGDDLGLRDARGNEALEGIVGTATSDATREASRIKIDSYELELHGGGSAEMEAESTHFGSSIVNEIVSHQFVSTLSW